MKHLIISLILVFALRSHAGILDVFRSKGILGQITYQVEDSMGNPVSNATVRASFRIHGGKNNVVKAQTDQNGSVTVEGRTNISVSTKVMKTGYYPSFHEHFFLRDGKPEEFENGVWHPNNPTIRIVLREMRDPNPAGFRSAHAANLDLDTTYGVSFRTGKIFVPGSNDLESPPDFFFSYSCNQESPRAYSVTNVWHFFCTNANDGALCVPKCTASEQEYPYEFPTNGYVGDVVYEFVRTQETIRNTWPKHGQFWLWRIGSHTGPDGNPAAHYALVESLSVGGEINGRVSFLMTYFYNETENDRSAEYAPGHFLTSPFQKLKPKNEK